MTRDLCKKLPKPLRVPVWRVLLIVIAPVVLPLSCVKPACMFVWELLKEYKDVFVRPELDQW